MQELFARILKIVSEVTEVPPGTIVSRDKHEETVDARYLLVYLLYRNGLYPSAIARYTGLSVRTVNTITSAFTQRLESRRMLAVNLEETQRQLSGNG